MKKLLLGFALIATTMAFTGCAVTSNLTTSHNVTQTSVELSQSNYSVVKDAEGAANGMYVLGIGGMSKESLNANATAEMLKNANLKGSQAIINPTFMVKRVGFFPLFWKYKATAYGQVIEFEK